MASMCNTLFGKFDSQNDDPAAIGPDERWLSVAAGGCLAGFGLSRLRLGALAALGAGAFMVYRGANGRCPLRGRLLQGLGQGDASWQGRPAEGPWQRDDAQPAGVGASTAAVAPRSPNEVDSGDEAMMESFPASDPPSYTGNATPAVRIE